MHPGGVSVLWSTARVTAVVVPRAQGRQKPAMLRGCLSATVHNPHNPHLTLPVNCCVTRGGESHPVRDGPWVGGNRTTANPENFLKTGVAGG